MSEWQQFRVTGTDFVERVDNFRNRVPDYDPRTGEHLWVVTNVFRVNPQQAAEGQALLDHESMIQMSPVFCYHCEEPFRPGLAHRRCPGEPK